MKTAIRKKMSKKKAGSPVKLTMSIQEELLRFMEFHPAGRLSRNLRSLLIEFLMFDGGTEAVFLRDLLYDLMGLYELLDCIEREGGVKKSDMD